jgi:hypothetical protein
VVLFLSKSGLVDVLLDELAYIRGRFVVKELSIVVSKCWGFKRHFDSMLFPS